MNQHLKTTSGLRYMPPSLGTADCVALENEALRALADGAIDFVPHGAIPYLDEDRWQVRAARAAVLTTVETWLSSELRAVSDREALLAAVARVIAIAHEQRAAL